MRARQRKRRKQPRAGTYRAETCGGATSGGGGGRRARPRETRTGKTCPGHRAGKSVNNALDRVRQTARRNREEKFTDKYAIKYEKMNYVLDADIRGFRRHLPRMAGQISSNTGSWFGCRHASSVGCRQPRTVIPGPTSGLTVGPEAGTQCGSSARWGLYGGRPAPSELRAVPTVKCAGINRLGEGNERVLR